MVTILISDVIRHKYLALHNGKIECSNVLLEVACNGIHTLYNIHVTCLMTRSSVIILYIYIL